MAKEGGGGDFLGTAIKVLALVAGIPAAAAAAYQRYAVTTGKTQLQDLINPPEKAPMVIVAPGNRRPATEAKECSSDTEKVAWAKARESKTRADYNSYILAFSNCPNAATARDALLTCHQEQREAWEETPIKSNQAVRGGEENGQRAGQNKLRGDRQQYRLSQPGVERARSGLLVQQDQRHRHGLCRRSLAPHAAVAMDGLSGLAGLTPSDGANQAEFRV